MCYHGPALRHRVEGLTERRSAPWTPSHEVAEDVDGDREDDCRVLLRRDVVQRLQVAQLEFRETTGSVKW